jgi:hypothetical protein
MRIFAYLSLERFKKNREKSGSGRLMLPLSSVTNPNVIMRERVLEDLDLSPVYY